MAAVVAWGETMFPPTSPPSSSGSLHLRAAGLRANESPFGPRPTPVTNVRKELLPWQR